MNLCRPDEALDWLERYVRSELFYKKNYNKIKSSRLPYLVGVKVNHYSDIQFIKENILNKLRWKCFDPIRDTDRFKALVKAAEESTAEN